MLVGKGTHAHGRCSFAVCSASTTSHAFTRNTSLLFFFLFFTWNVFVAAQLTASTFVHSLLHLFPEQTNKDFSRRAKNLRYHRARVCHCSLAMVTGCPDILNLLNPDPSLCFPFVVITSKHVLVVTSEEKENKFRQSLSRLTRVDFVAKTLWSDCESRRSHRLQYQTRKYAGMLLLCRESEPPREVAGEIVGIAYDEKEWENLYVCVWVGDTSSYTAVALVSL